MLLWKQFYIRKRIKWIERDIKHLKEQSQKDAKQQEFWRLHLAALRVEEALLNVKKKP